MPTREELLAEKERVKTRASYITSKLLLSEKIALDKLLVLFNPIFLSLLKNNKFEIAEAKLKLLDKIFIELDEKTAKRKAAAIEDAHSSRSRRELVNLAPQPEPDSSVDSDVDHGLSPSPAAEASPVVPMVGLFSPQRAFENSSLPNLYHEL